MQGSRPNKSKAALILTGLATLATAVSACSREGEIDVSSGVGVYANLDGCPVVAVPNGTGDITLFSQSGNYDAAAIDVVANMTNVRGNCASGGSQIYNEVTFEVIGTRTNVAGARQVTLPYYSVVLQAGENVRAKQVGQVTLNFADGQRVATAQGKASATVAAELTVLPADVYERITARREPGEEDAAVDPLSDPRVRAEVRRTSFEHLVGFQLSEDQLAYNVTR